MFSDRVWGSSESKFGLMAGGFCICRPASRLSSSAVADSIIQCSANCTQTCSAWGATSSASPLNSSCTCFSSAAFASAAALAALSNRIWALAASSRQPFQMWVQICYRALSQCVRMLLRATIQIPRSLANGELNSLYVGKLQRFRMVWEDGIKTLAFQPSKFQSRPS